MKRWSRVWKRPFWMAGLAGAAAAAWAAGTIPPTTGDEEILFRAAAAVEVASPGTLPDFQLRTDWPTVAFAGTSTETANVHQIQHMQLLLDAAESLAIDAVRAEAESMVGPVSVNLERNRASGMVHHFGVHFHHRMAQFLVAAAASRHASSSAWSAALDELQGALAPRSRAVLTYYGDFPAPSVLALLRMEPPLEATKQLLAALDESEERAIAGATLANLLSEALLHYESAQLYQVAAQHNTAHWSDFLFARAPRTYRGSHLYPFALGRLLHWAASENGPERPGGSWFQFAAGHSFGSGPDDLPRGRMALLRTELAAMEDVVGSEDDPMIAGLLAGATTGERAMLHAILTEALSPIMHHVRIEDAPDSFTRLPSGSARARFELVRTAAAARVFRLREGRWPADAAELRSAGLLAPLRAKSPTPRTLAAAVAYVPPLHGEIECGEMEITSATLSAALGMPLSTYNEPHSQDGRPRRAAGVRLDEDGPDHWRAAVVLVFDHDRAAAARLTALCVEDFARGRFECEIRLVSAAETPGGRVRAGELDLRDPLAELRAQREVRDLSFRHEPPALEPEHAPVLIVEARLPRRAFVVRVAPEPPLRDPPLGALAVVFPEPRTE